MAIQKKEMFTVICDNCGKDVCENKEYSAWNDKNYAEEIAMESDWKKENEKHYCEDCWDYDNEDNLIIKKQE